jgi:hypothetical protein
MPHPTASALPALCAVLTAAAAAAQAPPPAGHSTSSNSPKPVQLLSAEPDGDDAADQRPAGPPRIAQYPLENDPYERPPEFRRPPVVNPPQRTPAAPLPMDEEPAWLSLDELRLNAAYLHDSPEGLGIVDVVTGAKISTGLPGVTLGPQFGVHFLGSSGLPDVPEHLYDLSFEMTAGMPLGEDWIVMAAVSPGVFTDFSGGAGDTFRIPVRLLAFYKWSDALTVAGGVLYLDRKDVSLLPAVGLSYKPNDHFHVELWFPRPKISWRYLKRPAFERWVYVVGEFGGGSWGVERDDGRPDTFSYRDYRAMVGVEQRAENGLSWYSEAGLIFNRSYELDQANTSVDLDNTAGMQFGIRF